MLPTVSHISSLSGVLNSTMVSLDHHGCRIVGDLKSGQRVQASEAPGFCIFNTADRFCVFGTSVMHIAQSLRAYGDQPIVSGLGTLDFALRRGTR